MEEMKVNVELESEVNELFSKTKVIQKFKNKSKDPLELKIYVYKKKGLIFSSFSSKIGDSIMVKSKVIKKEKAKEKYTDSVAGGNAAIFVSDDPYNENRIIINMGNIPANSEVLFISEFISLVETSKSYEFELFRNFPIFQGVNLVYENSELKGNIHIKTKNKICKIEKEILMEQLKIVKEKNEMNNNYLISYEIKALPNFSPYNLEYIPCSKIFFELEEDNKPIIYSQKSLFDKNELNYYMQYKMKSNNLESEKELEEKPALFIFLIDQSGSMSGSSIKIASQALKIFIQSLPAKSYYQIIGFGSSFVKYDNTPKKYIQNNINKTIEMIDNLTAKLGGTDIYSPLKDIFDSYKIYDKINLPKNIFLLTDGEIENKKETLELIEKNNSKFTIYSIGIGNSFDKDLIKNAGLLGKGSYNFCPKLEGLNTIIADEVSRAIRPYMTKINFNTSLDNDNIIKNNNIPNIMRENEIINFNYIINDKNKKNKIKVNVEYLENDKNEIKKNYEIIPEEVPEGEELSKLIINNYINNSDLSNEEKIKLALKYQIFTNETSLFAEVELSEKVSKEMKLKIIGDKDNNIIKYNQPSNYSDFFKNSIQDLNNYYDGDNEILNNDYDGDKEFFGISKIENYDSIQNECCINELGPPLFLELSQCIIEPLLEKKRDRKSKGKNKKLVKDKNTSESGIISDKKEKKIDLNKKEDVMKIINTQDFVKGFWNENKETKNIKKKYNKEYNLLKELKNKNMNNNVIMTIIIIYFINKEHSELLKELSRIIKKAKLFIKKETKSSYEDIIKEIDIN